MEQLPSSQQPHQQNDPSKAPADKQHQLEEFELKSARTLSTVATIAGPVSFIIGGVALSTVALVCGIIALTKVRRVLARDDSAQRPYARALRQTAIMSIAIAVVALVLNAVSVALMMPVLIQAMQTGDYSAILGNAASTIQGTPNPSNGSSGNAWG